MSLLKKPFLILLFFVSVTVAAWAATFDWTAPPLGSSEAEKRNDLNLELGGIRDRVESFCLALSDETTTITTGTAKVTWRMPYAFTLISPFLRASVNTASTSGLPTIDVNENGTTIMNTTKLTIDANEKTSATAAAQPGVTDTALGDDAEMTADVDVAGTGAKGLKLCLEGHK